MRGSVQLLGTTNCSICFNGCVTCSNSDPNNCLDCGNRRYSSGGDCLKCPTGCTTCTSSTSCQNCDLGYWLVGTSCNAIPANCAGLDSNTGLCTGCFQAYKLTADSKGCDIDLSCNSTAAGCETCPNSYFLFNAKCYTCNVGPTVLPARQPIARYARAAPTATTWTAAITVWLAPQTVIPATLQAFAARQAPATTSNSWTRETIVEKLHSASLPAPPAPTIKTSASAA